LLAAKARVDAFLDSHLKAVRPSISGEK